MLNRCAHTCLQAKVLLIFGSVFEFAHVLFVYCKNGCNYWCKVNATSIWFCVYLQELQFTGMFAMTERGHGSNVRGIITEARYDQYTQVIPRSTLCCCLLDDLGSIVIAMQILNEQFTPKFEFRHHRLICHKTLLVIYTVKLQSKKHTIITIQYIFKAHLKTTKVDQSAVQKEKIIIKGDIKHTTNIW